MATATTERLRHTPLIEAHRAAGAKLVPFAGWEMPVQYEGIKVEHQAVRRAGGVFDVSHMGQIETEGPEAQKLLQRLLSNDVAKLEIGGAQYSCLCREDGGVLDDLFTYRPAGDRYLTVTNAANHASDFEWFRRQATEFDAEVRDVAGRYAMLAVQGPEARDAVDGLAAGELPARLHTAELDVAGQRSLVCGTGYTGEDGVELLMPPDGALEVWDQLLAARVTPAGLGARDTLRMEVCYCLYGNELRSDRNPIEAALGWCCKEETAFIGSEPIARARAEGTSEVLVPFKLTGTGIPRQGNAVLRDGHAVGEVTSGTLSPCLGVGIGMGYVGSHLAESGTEIEIDVRGRRRGARVETRPLYREGSAGG